jgi:hypothetical protein
VLTFSKKLLGDEELAMEGVKSAVIALAVLGLLPGTVFSESNPKVWTPQPKFRIENRSYIETLIFVSGISYALTASNLELQQAGQKNFYCLKGSDSIGSKLLFDILNDKHDGNISSEQAIETIVQGLKKRYPCGG